MPTTARRISLRRVLRGWTTDFTDGKVKSVYDASLNYKAADIPTIILGVKMAAWVVMRPGG
ncbi:MAG: hypothetical protein R2865_01505 [Deinococcales bacterium]